MILRVQNVVWILGCVACLIAFIFAFFPFSKTVFKQSRHLHNTSRHLAYLLSSSIDFYRNLDTSRQLGGSIEKPPVPLIAPRSIKLILLWTPLDTSRQLHLSKLLKLDTYLDTSRHLYLSRITKHLYKGSNAIRSSFSRSLLICPCLFIFQTSLTHF